MAPSCHCALGSPEAEGPLGHSAHTARLVWTHAGGTDCAVPLPNTGRSQQGIDAQAALRLLVCPISATRATYNSYSD
jgi:hypothetical protein